MFKPRYSRADYYSSSPFGRSYSREMSPFYSREDYKREDYERYQRRGNDYRVRFSFDNDGYAEDYNYYSMRDYSPMRFAGDRDADDYWMRRQRDYAYRAREESPRRFSSRDYDHYVSRDNEEYAQFREERGRSLSRNRGRYYHSMSSFSPRRFADCSPGRYEDEMYRHRYRMRHRSLSPVPYVGFSRMERSPDEEVHVSVRARSMTPASRRGVAWSEFHPEDAGFGPRMMYRSRRDNHKRHEFYKESEKVHSSPNSFSVQKTCRMEETRDSSQA